MSDSLVRINKYLADLGLCSRREAETLITKGWIKVNGQVLSELAYKVSPSDKVEIDPKVEIFLDKKKTIIINKPLGYVSSQAEDGYEPAIRVVKPENYGGFGQPPRLGFKDFAPVGRLDIDSTGLLLLSQDGKIARTIIGPDSNIEKEYVILVNGNITSDKIKKLRHGLELDGKALKPAIVKQEDKQKIRMILTEGKKRQIRRMCDLVDLKVTSLRRVRIGKLKIGSLKVGQWRLLTKKDRII